MSGNGRDERYEHGARQEIERWRAAPPGTVAGVVGKVTKPVDWAARKLLEGTAAERALEGAISAAMDAGSWTVDQDSIIGKYRDRGYRLETIEDIPRTVPLEVIDKMVSPLGRNYRLAATGQGGAAGAAATLFTPLAGGVALTADVALITTVSCRAVAEYAAHYGVDVSLDGERHAAMQVLHVASATDEASKQAALHQLARISAALAKGATWAELEALAGVKGLKELAGLFTSRVTKAKLGQLITALGIAIGAGYNAWYMDQVVVASYFTYRERYLQATT